MQTNTDTHHRLSIIVNGKEIPANPFVTSVFINVLTALIASLKTDEKEIQHIRIEIEKKGTV